MSGHFGAVASLVSVFRLETEWSEQTSNPQLPLFLIYCQAPLHVCAQFALLVALILQLTDQIGRAHV